MKISWMIRMIVVSVIFIIHGLAMADFLPSTFSAEFEQSFVSALTGRMNKSKGVIDYKYPGHIKFNVTWPDPTLFVANPTKSWQYTPPFIPGEKGQVVERPSKNLMLFKFFDVLKEGLKSNALYEVKQEKDYYWAIFKENSVEETGLIKAQLFFTKKEELSLIDLSQAILHYKDKREVTLKLIDMRTQVEFPANYFIFDESTYPATLTVTPRATTSSELSTGK